MAGRKGGLEPSFVSSSGIGQRLRDVSGTLETLIIDIDRDMEFRDHSGIGTLHHFIAMKHLGIQSQILLSEWDRLIEGYDDDVIYDETLFSQHTAPKSAETSNELLERRIPRRLGPRDCSSTQEPNETASFYFAGATGHHSIPPHQRRRSS